LPYDYYGEYGYAKNNPDPYTDRLVMDYTFDHPKQHAMVGISTVYKYIHVNSSTHSRAHTQIPNLIYKAICSWHSDTCIL